MTVHINSVLALLNSREAMRERISEPISIQVSNLVGDSPDVSKENSLHVTKENSIRVSKMVGENDGHDGAHSCERTSSSGGGCEDRNQWVRGPPTILFVVRLLTFVHLS